MTTESVGEHGDRHGVGDWRRVPSEKKKVGYKYSHVILPVREFVQACKCLYPVAGTPRAEREDDKRCMLFPTKNNQMTCRSHLLRLFLQPPIKDDGSHNPRAVEFFYQ